MGNLSIIFIINKAFNMTKVNSKMGFLILHPKIELTCLITGCSGQPQASPHRSRACPANLTAWLREQTRMYPLCRQVDLKREDRRDWGTHARCLLPNSLIISVTLLSLGVKEEHTEAESVIFFQLYWGYNWCIILCNFNVYNILIWSMCILRTNYHSRVNSHLHHTTAGLIHTFITPHNHHFFFGVRIFKIHS